MNIALTNWLKDFVKLPTSDLYLLMISVYIYLLLINYSSYYMLSIQIYFQIKKW